MLSDEEMDELFEEFLDSPELSSWQGDLSGREYEDAKRLFRKTIRKAIRLHGADPSDMGADEPG